MKTLLFTMIFIGMILGCSGDKDTPSDVPKVEINVQNSDNNDSQQEIVLDNPLTSDDMTVNESDFSDTSNFQQLRARSLNPVVKYAYMPDSDALRINSADVDNASLDVYAYATDLDKSIIESKVGKNLYIDGDFAGVISAYDNGRILVKDANSSADLFSSIDVGASNDEILDVIASSALRSFSGSKMKPHIYAINKNVSKLRGVIRNEPVLVIEFPKGYALPVRRGVDVECSLGDAKCDAKLSYDEKYSKGIDETESFGSVVFSTNDSKIEIGLGAYIRAMYDYNTVSSNKFHFEFTPSAYYMVDVKLTINGSSITEGSKTFDIVENGLNIAIPLHKLVELNLNIKPELVLSMKSAQQNKEVDFKASLYTKRSGQVRLLYTSEGSSVTKDIKDESNAISSPNGIFLKVDTGGDKIVGGLFPQIAIRPQLKIIKVDKSVNLAYVRNGVMAETVIKGVIDDNWIVENSEVVGSRVEDVFLKTSLFGLIDFKWDIKVGDIDIVSSDNWTQIYKSSKFKLIEWMSQYLQQPKIIVNSYNNERHIRFDIESAYKKSIRYYYSIDGSDIDDKVSISDHRDNTVYKIWKDGDPDIVLDEDKNIKVKAVVFTDEIAAKDDVLWRWGMSISKQAEKMAVYLPEPTISPVTKDFVSSINVDISQSHGDSIKYSINGGLSYIECGVGSCSVNIDKSLSLIAKAVKTIDSIEYNSTLVSGTYRKCADHEALGDQGTCTTKCPYLWDVVYEQRHIYDYGAGFDIHSPEAVGNYFSEYSLFKDVMIYPRADMFLPDETYTACSPYFNNTIAIYTYEHNDGSSWVNNNEYKSELVYAGLTNKSGLSNRDPEGTNDVPLDEVDYKYDPIPGTEVYPDVYSTVGDSSSAQVEKDIFGQIYDRKNFSVSDNEGRQYTFSPRAYVSSSGEIIDNNTPDNSDACVDSSIDNSSDNDVDNGGNVDGNLHEAISHWDLNITVDYPPIGAGSIAACKYSLEYKNIPVHCDTTADHAVAVINAAGGYTMIQPNAECIDSYALPTPIFTKISGCQDTTSIKDDGISIFRAGNELIINAFATQVHQDASESPMLLSVKQGVNFIDCISLDKSVQDVSMNTVFNQAPIGIKFTPHP